MDLPAFVVDYLRLVELVALCQTSWRHLLLSQPDLHPRRNRLFFALRAAISPRSKAHRVVGSYLSRCLEAGYLSPQQASRVSYYLYLSSQQRTDTSVLRIDQH